MQVRGEEEKEEIAASTHVLLCSGTLRRGARRPLRPKLYEISDERLASILNHFSEMYCLPSHLDAVVHVPDPSTGRLREWGEPVRRKEASRVKRSCHDPNDGSSNESFIVTTVILRSCMVALCANALLYPRVLAPLARRLLARLLVPACSGPPVARAWRAGRFPPRPVALASWPSAAMRAAAAREWWMRRAHAGRGKHARSKESSAARPPHRRRYWGGRARGARGWRRRCGADRGPCAEVKGAAEEEGFEEGG